MWLQSFSDDDAGVGGGVVLGCAIDVDNSGKTGFDPKAEGWPVFEEHFQPDGVMAGRFGLLGQSGNQLRAITAFLIVGVQHKHRNEENVWLWLVVMAVEVADGLVV